MRIEDWSSAVERDLERMGFISDLRESFPSIEVPSTIPRLTELLTFSYSVPVKFEVLENRVWLLPNCLVTIHLEGFMTK